jgi:monofunctional chorismate mutase
MSDLRTYRQEIDAIDEQLSCLLNRRMDISHSVALFKKENECAVLDCTREKEIIQKARDRSARDELKTYQEAFFKHLMMLSRDYQQMLVETNQIKKSK